MPYKDKQWTFLLTTGTPKYTNYILGFDHADDCQQWHQEISSMLPIPKRKADINKTIVKNATKHQSIPERSSNLDYAWIDMVNKLVSEDNYSWDLISFENSIKLYGLPND